MYTMKDRSLFTWIVAVECLEKSLKMNTNEARNITEKGAQLDGSVINYNPELDKGECGFSGRLIAWILNILSWIKYIIPVVVILFGIIDFIKATGSEKDDAMKKAQANFVKRLIAAALIFLVPSIIEFILPKFGFDYNSCGIFKNS